MGLGSGFGFGSGLGSEVILDPLNHFAMMTENMVLRMASFHYVDACDTKSCKVAKLARHIYRWVTKQRSDHRWTHVTGRRIPGTHRCVNR
jgi:hypothetical protein